MQSHKVTKEVLTSFYIEWEEVITDAQMSVSHATKQGGGGGVLLLTNAGYTHIIAQAAVSEQLVWGLSALWQ